MYSIILERAPTMDDKDDNPPETRQNNKSVQCVYSIILEKAPTKDDKDGDPMETSWH